MPQSAPVLSDVTIQEMIDNPYPIFDRVRKMGSAVWVDAARINLVTRFDDIVTVERNPQIFASTNPDSLMNVVMGHSLMRKDGEEHRVERIAINPSFQPDVIKNHWQPTFERISDELITDFERHGQTDLFSSFAAPMASKALLALLGFENVAWQDLAAWSQAMMDGVGNYQADPEISAKAQAAADAINDAIDAVIDKHKAEQNPTILSSMVHAENPHSIEQIRANIKVVVGGGLNEPRDSILSTLLGLLQNPDQRRDVENDPKLFLRAFEESTRWISPIGMYPRRVTQDTSLGDTHLREGDQIGICVGAANRDPVHFNEADKFDLHRKKAPHLGFGAGPHFCAGSWTARIMVGGVALPMLFSRLKNLRLNPELAVEERGWVFRGPISLPVLWDA